MGNKKKQRQKREQKRGRVENHGTADKGAGAGQHSSDLDSDQDHDQDHQDEAGHVGSDATQSHSQVTGAHSQVTEAHSQVTEAHSQVTGAESLEPIAQDSGSEGLGHLGTGDSEVDRESADEKEDYLSCEEDPGGVDNKGIHDASGSQNNLGSHDAGERSDKQDVSEAGKSKSETETDTENPDEEAPATAVKPLSQEPGDTRGDVHADEETEQNCRDSGESEFTTPEECHDPNCNNSSGTDAKPEGKCKVCYNADDLGQLCGDSLTEREVQIKDDGESEDAGTMTRQNPPDQMPSMTQKEKESVSDSCCQQKDIDGDDYADDTKEEEDSDLSSDSEASNNADNSNIKHKIDDGYSFRSKLSPEPDSDEVGDEKNKETFMEGKTANGVDEEGFTKVKGKKGKRGKKNRSKDFCDKKIVCARPPSANLMFYQGKIRSKPDEMFIDDIHKHWYDDMEILEYKHGYIQWLFPISEGKGMNFHAQALQPHEAEALREDKRAMERFMKSYQMMLNFYGMKLADSETGQVERADNWRERFRNLNYSSHNHLRVTRILKCLGELGHERYKYPLLEFLVHEVLETRELWSAVDSCRDYWIHTLADTSQMEQLFALAVELEFQAERQYRERERVKQGVQGNLHDGFGNEYQHDMNRPDDKPIDDTTSQAQEDEANNPEDEKHDIPGPEDEKHDIPDPEDEKHDIPGPEDEKHNIPGPEDEKHDIPGPEDEKHDIPGPKDEKHDIPGPEDEKHDKPGPEVEKQDLPGPEDEKQDIPGPKDEKQGLPGPEEQAKDTQELEAKMRSLSLDDDNEEQLEQQPQHQGQESRKDLNARAKVNGIVSSDLLAEAVPQNKAYGAPSRSHRRGQAQAEEETITDVFYQPDASYQSDKNQMDIRSGTRVFSPTSGASQNCITAYVMGVQNSDYVSDYGFSSQNCFSGGGWDSSGRYGYGSGFPLQSYAQGYVGSGDPCSQTLPQWEACFPAHTPHQDPGVWFGDVHSPLSEAYETRLPHRVSCTRVYGTRGAPTYYLERVYWYPSSGHGDRGHRGRSSAMHLERYTAPTRGHRSGAPSHFGPRGRGRGSGTSHYYRVRPY